MHTYIKRLMAGIAAVASLLIVSSSLLAVAQTPTTTPKDAVCEGVVLTGGSCDPNKASGPSVSDTVELVINTLSLIVGVAAVIMIIIGGFKYVISNGESSNVSGAKNTILYAIIGLVVAVLAQVIVKFVLSKAA